jgi:hypothetical protein
MNGDFAPAGANSERWLRRLAVAGFLAVLAFGILVPIYTDEIGWRFQERAWIDGVDKAFNDTCGPNTLARPPWFMLPVRWFSATANQALADPLFVRLEGLICALIWAGLLGVLIARLEPDQAKRRGMHALSYALLGLGTLPFLLVLSRPEQPLILAYTLMILIALSPPWWLGGTGSAWLKGAAMVGLAGIGASYHLKGVVYAPIALACIAMSAAGPGTRVPRLVMGAVLAAMIAVAASYWVGRFQCLGDPKTAAILARENIASILTSRGSLPDILGQVLHGANPLNYVWLTAPGLEFSSWLPDKIFPPALRQVVGAALTLVWGSALLIAGGNLVRFILRKRLGALAMPPALLALAVLGCVAVWGMSQVNRNPYEAAHVLPMLAIFIALCFSLPDDGAAWLGRARGWLVRLAVPVVLASEAALLGFSGGPLIAVARSSGYLPSQRLSVSIADYGTVRRDIHEAMKQAGIPDDRRRHGLVVDDITYLALQRDLLPYHRLGLFEVWNFGIDNPAQYLLDRKSDGVVVSCANLPFDFETVAVRAGQICAISPAGLQQLAAPLPALDDLDFKP